MTVLTYFFISGGSSEEQWFHISEEQGEKVSYLHRLARPFSPFCKLRLQTDSYRLRDEKTVNGLGNIGWVSIFRFTFDVSMSPCSYLRSHVSITPCLHVHVSMSPFLHVSMSPYLCFHVSLSSSPCLPVSMFLSRIQQMKDETNEKRELPFVCCRNGELSFVC
jgi:hypothetical protein